MSRGVLNKVCVSRRGLNNVCVSRGLKAQQFHSPGLNNVCVSQSGLKAQQLPSPGQAKRRPGLGMRAMCAPCKGKSLCLLYTFALTGRSYICLPQPRRRFACPGLSTFGLSARCSRRHCSASCSRRHCSARGSRRHCSARIGSRVVNPKLEFPHTACIVKRP